MLDNKVLAGVAGYHVIMPLRIGGLPKYVLVNRGWVAAGGGTEADCLKSERRRQRDGHRHRGAAGACSLELSSAETTGPVWQNLTIERYRRRMKLPASSRW